MLTYWFYPLPGNASYGNSKVVFLFVVILLMLSLSFFINSRRKRSGDPVFRRLSRSWATVLRLFAVVALVLLVARVEDIQLLSMRFLWVLWVLALFLYGALQMWLFRKRYYAIQPRERNNDPREAYIPKAGSGKR